MALQGSRVAIVGAPWAFHSKPLYDLLWAMAVIPELLRLSIRLQIGSKRGVSLQRPTRRGGSQTAPSVAQKLSKAMLRIFFASGKELAHLPLSELQPVNVLALKRYLVEKHFEKRYSRFQLRILKEGDPNELEDQEAFTESTDLQLMLLNHLQADEERDIIFLDQCLTGELEEVEASLKALQDPNTCADGSALCSAVDHKEVLQLLLEAAADPEVSDHHRMTALHEAAFRGHDQAVELLLDFRANMEAKDHEGRRPLHLAAWGGHLDVLCRLLQSAADLEAMDFQALRPLHLAATIGHEEIVRILLNRGVSWTATATGCFQPFKALLDPSRLTN